MKQCFTDDMLADFSSKPLQGIMFNKFKKKMLRINNKSKESRMKSKLQKNCMILKLQKSTTVLKNYS